MCEILKIYSCTAWEIVKIALGGHVILYYLFIRFLICFAEIH